MAINYSSFASSSWILSIFFELYSSNFLSCSYFCYFNLLNSASSSLCQGYNTIVWNINALVPTIKLVIGRYRVIKTIDKNILISSYYKLKPTFNLWITYRFSHLNYLTFLTIKKTALRRIHLTIINLVKASSSIPS